MQDIDQNMDELFRKAAADYPLKLNESGWDDIAAALPTNGQAAPAKKNNLRKYTTGLFLLLALLLVGGITNYTTKNDSKKNINEKTALHENILPAINQNKIETPALENKLIAVAGSKQKKNLTNSLAVQPINAYTKSFFKTKSTAKQNGVIELPVQKNENTEANGLFYTAEKRKLFNPLPVTLPDLISSDHFAAGEKLKVEKNVLPETKIILPSDTKTGTKISPKNNFYAGIMSGPLLDEVKNQGLKKTGFSAGIIAGYQLKKNLSVETGLFFAKKPYYSAGKYFSMKKIGGSMQGMDLLSLEGNNQVLEIPLRLKYDFLQRSKSNLFSSAGISSYVSTYEKNNYLVFINGAQQTMLSSYKNKSRSLAATLELSAGYEHNAGKRMTIRIEPYMQIPLKGMGVGSMQMKSSGLRLGIIKFFN
jgi:hypothetical protein